MITPEIKDQILKYLCGKCEFEYLSFVDNEDLLKLATLNELEGFVEQLKRMRLVDYKSEVYEDQTHVILYLEAQDFLRIGGFTAKEIILKQNIEKLNLEMQKLRENPSDPLAAVANVTSILANVLTFFGAK